MKSTAACREPLDQLGILPVAAAGAECDAPDGPDRRDRVVHEPHVPIGRHRLVGEHRVGALLGGERQVVGPELVGDPHRLGRAAGEELVERHRRVIDVELRVWRVREDDLRLDHQLQASGVYVVRHLLVEGEILVVARLPGIEERVRDVHRDTVVLMRTSASSIHRSTARALGSSNVLP